MNGTGWRVYAKCTAFVRLPVHCVRAHADGGSSNGIKVSYAAIANMFSIPFSSYFLNSVTTLNIPLQLSVRTTQDPVHFYQLITQAATRFSASSL